MKENEINIKDDFYTFTNNLIEKKENFILNNQNYFLKERYILPRMIFPTTLYRMRNLHIH